MDLIQRLFTVHGERLFTVHGERLKVNGSEGDIRPNFYRQIRSPCTVHPLPIMFIRFQNISVKYAMNLHFHHFASLESMRAFF